MTAKLDRLHRIDELRARLEAERRSGRRIGLVPTMGALHAGHASLIEAAATRSDMVVTTVFVNPLQFAPTDDLAAYPRDLDGDAELAAASGASIVFAPSVEEMYPFGAGPGAVLTSVHVAAITDVLDGLARPGHFDGVATVVSKLFNIVGPCTAFFGEKDFQQLAVIRRMVHDLSVPVDVVGCPTVREPDGLALSSRNRYLTAEQRAGAPVIHRALQAGREAIERGDRSDAHSVEMLMTALLRSEPVIESVDYATVVDALTLRNPSPLAGELRLLIAARVGRARLIDNVGATVPPSATP